MQCSVVGFRDKGSTSFTDDTLDQVPVQAVTSVVLRRGANLVYTRFLQT